MRRLFLTFLFVFAPAIATAEQDPIDEIFVTATRRPASSSEISSSLSLATADKIRVHKLTTDALKSLVGVYVQQTTPGQGAAIIRGQRGSSILHLVDGMRLNNAIFRSAPTQYLALVPTTAIDRIEVIRGTPAALYGSEAVGGVVQVVSHRPNFDSMKTIVRREFQVSLDTAELQRSLSASVDVGTKTFAASFSAQYINTGDRRTGDGGRISPSGFESKAARILLVASPTDERSWSLDVQLLEQPRTPRVDELVPGFGQTQPSSSEFFFAPNQRMFVHAQHAKKGGALGLDWRFDIAWQRIVDDRVTRGFGATQRIHESNRSDLSGVTVSASGRRDAISWIVGGEIYYDRVHSKRSEEDTATGQSQSVPSRFPNGATVAQSAIYSSMDRLMSSRHRVNAGLRFSDVNISVPNTAVTSGQSLSAGKLSGDLGWIFNVRENWQILANVGFGFRAPNIFDLGTLGDRPGNRFNIPNSNLDSEHALHGDIGIRYRSNQRQFDLVLYSLQYDDRITSVLTGDVTADGRDIVQSVNAAKSSIRGIEAGIDINFSNNISAHAILNYTWGEQRISGDSWQPADRIPPLSGRASLKFDTGGDWKVEGWIESAAQQDRLSARDVRDVRIDPAGSAGWTSIGAKADWSDDHWHYAIAVENLGDKRYRVHGSGLESPGRNLSLTVRRSW